MESTGVTYEVQRTGFVDWQNPVGDLAIVVLAGAMLGCLLVNLGWRVAGKGWTLHGFDGGRRILRQRFRTEAQAEAARPAA